MALENHGIQYAYDIYEADGTVRTRMTGTLGHISKEYADGTELPTDSQREAGKTTNYYYQGDMALYTTDGTGNKNGFNVYGLEENVIASGRYTGSCAGQYLTYNKDLRGSVTSLLKADGSCALAYQYTDFGETTQRGDADIENEICYTGGIYDDSTGLYYLNARYYAPQDGRFLSQDTYRGEAGEYATWNLYAYCANNPVGYVDPSGHTGYEVYMPQVADILEKIGETLIEITKIAIAGVAGYVAGRAVIAKGKPKTRKVRTSHYAIDYSKIRIPQVTIPEVKVPDINIPNINWPNFEVPKITIPGVPELGIPDIAIPGIKISNDDSGGKDIKNVYNSIKDAPKYPKGFRTKKNGTKLNKVKNLKVLEKLRKVEKGKWSKVYKNGYDASGNKISIHYFQSESGKVFDVKVKPGWSDFVK